MSQLANVLRGRTCILGIGNRMRGDDGAGSWVAEKVDPGELAEVFDGGVAPENYLEKIVRVKPGAVFLVDAVEFGGAPGDIRVFEPNHMAFSGLSSHALPLRMTAEYLAARSSARIILIGIQPAALDAVERLSEPVARSVSVLAKTLSRMLRSV